MMTKTDAEKNSVSVDSCPVCASVDLVSVCDVFDDRYGHPGRFALAACKSCGHLMTLPRLQESELGTLYGTYYPRKHAVASEIRRDAGMVVRPFAALQRWLMGTDNQGQYSVRAGESVLDIGCGSGLSLMEAATLGATAYGVEADPNVMRLADELGFQVHIGSFHDQPFPGKAFDLVTLNQVIEHVPAPDQLLSKIHSRLRPGGRVVLVFPNVGSVWCKLFGRRWINWHVPYHLHHFSRRGFSRMAEACGFRVTRVRSVTPNLWTILQFRTLFNEPRRGVSNPMWRVEELGANVGAGQRASSSLAGTVRRWWRRCVYVVLLVPIGLANRFFDAFGVGDSLVVELVPQERP